MIFNGEVNGCILSKFYIKPQHRLAPWRLHYVVSYRNSTSNHNGKSTALKYFSLYLIEILHQTTTDRAGLRPRRCCILSKFYIKPQLIADPVWLKSSCILSKFYIKPQHECSSPMEISGCILSKFYIKPQLFSCTIPN